MKKIKVGIIGCGAIGAALAQILQKKFSAQIVVSFLCDRQAPKALDLKKRLRSKPRPVSMTALIRSSDLIIEAASIEVARQAAKLAFQSGKNILVMSVGGLLDVKFSVGNSKGRVWVPSGAIAGVDALLAAREAGIQSVKILTRKPPKGLHEAPYFKKKKFPALRGQKEICVFKGSAREAVRSFPQNINVAALLSLAGLGPDKTQVQIWTSKRYRLNQHEITVQAKSGRFCTAVQNLPSPENPKTSALAIYAAAATIRKMLSAIRIGT